MSGVSRFDCYPSDFLNGVIGLIGDEISVYTIVLMLQYDRGKPVAYIGREREIAVRTGLPRGRLSKAVSRLIELGKLSLDGGCLFNARTSQELEKITKRFEENAKNSHEGGKATKQKWDDIRNENNGNEEPNGKPNGKPKIGPSSFVSSATAIKDNPPSSARGQISPKLNFEAECRRLVGEEPVLLAQDFHELMAEGFAETDVFAGITAAMAKPDFRLRHWKQLIGWARRAGQDRLEGEKKPITNGARAGPRKLSGQERDAQFYAECMRPENDERPDKFEGTTIDLEPVAAGVFGSDRHAAQRR